MGMRIGHARQAVSPSVPPMTAPHILKIPLAMVASNCRKQDGLQCRQFKLHFAV